MTDSQVLADLTFVTRNGDGTLNLWTPERPDSYAEACAMGRDYAAELQAFMRLTNNVQIFGAVMRAITRGGVYEAVETGFTTHFGILLCGVTVVESQAVEPVRAAA